MDRGETLLTPYGEFFDLLACDDISKGRAKPKRKKKKLSFDEFIALK